MLQTVNLNQAAAYVQRLDIVSFRKSILYGLLCTALYLVIVARLRYRRLQHVQKKYSHLRRNTFFKMTDREAWEIQKLIFQFEFPSMALKSLQFALFRVSWHLSCHLLALIELTIFVSRHMAFLLYPLCW
jgi:hypothetical protein